MGCIELQDSMFWHFLRCKIICYSLLIEYKLALWLPLLKWIKMLCWKRFGSSSLLLHCWSFRLDQPKPHWWRQVIQKQFCLWTGVRYKYINLYNDDWSMDRHMYNIASARRQKDLNGDMYNVHTMSLERIKQNHILSFGQFNGFFIMPWRLKSANYNVIDNAFME